MLDMRKQYPVLVEEASLVSREMIKVAHDICFALGLIVYASKTPQRLEVGCCRAPAPFFVWPVSFFRFPCCFISSFLWRVTAGVPHNLCRSCGGVPATTCADCFEGVALGL